MEKGTLIEFRVQGERRLAVADRPEGKKNWIFIDERGQSHSLRPQRIEYAIEGETYKPTDISPFLQDIQTYLDPSSLEVAWELLSEEGVGVTPAELAQLLFSDQSPSPRYAAHLLLSEDKIYFKKKGESYEPRSESQVAEIKHQIEVERERTREKEEFLMRARQRLGGEDISWQESDRARLEALEKLALSPEQTHRLAQDILIALERSPTAETALELLVALGRWSPHENLFLRRSSYPIHFPQKVLEVAQHTLQFPPPDGDGDRLDLTHLKVYTIDDESTREIDDGLSVEFLDSEGTVKLWIHIADPTRLVSLGDELDLEARRRSTSLYLPTGTVPMFPQDLATGPMSLIQGRVCPALSFAAVLDRTGAVLDYSIHSSSIQPTYRLTYDDADEMLELGITAEPELEQLAAAARLRHTWRSSQGSIDIRMPEASIKVKNDDEIEIEILDDSRSRQLVAEMMILTGEIAGRYAREHNIPLPFRGQPQPELPSNEELIQLPAGPVRFCALRRCMPRSEMGTVPSRHAGLGLDIYTQVTSPIRRYTDLLAHFQLKAHLRGDPLPFEPSQLQEILYSVISSAQEATLVERQTNRYWGLEYLRRHSDRVWQAIVLRWLREDDNLALILLEDLGLELPHRLNRPAALGDRLGVQVTSADPRQDLIRFREFLPQEAATATT
ncbi:MAG: ribonuclease R family protein [Cyanobacteriota bacterium]|nr:ribonuclease R family protein [Cyanobacteriota bacterium]